MVSRVRIPYLTSKLAFQVFYDSLELKIFRIVKITKEDNRFKQSYDALISRIANQGAQIKSREKIVESDMWKDLSSFSQFQSYISPSCKVALLHTIEHVSSRALVLQVPV